MKRFFSYFLLLILVAPAFAQSPAFSVESGAQDTLFQVNTDGSVRINAPTTKDHTDVLARIDAAGNAAWQPDGLALPYTSAYSGTTDALFIEHQGSKGSAANFRSANPDPTVSILNQGTGYGLIVNSTAQSSAARFTGDVLFRGGVMFEPNNVAGTAAFGVTTTFSELATFDAGVRMNAGLSLFGLATLQDLNVSETAGFADGLTSGGDVTLAIGADFNCGDCVGPEDVDENRGFYVSKSQLYTNEVSFNIGANGSGTARATCNDANDLPLDGGCFSTGGVRVRSFRNINWENPSEDAAYECTAFNPQSSTLSAQARITCIAVDGE